MRLALLLSTIAAAASTTNNLTIVAEWTSMQFAWPSAEARARAISSGEYVPEHNVMTGLKVCGPHVSPRCVKEMVFPTIPRWRTGVPSTLNMLVHDDKGAPLLSPWPSWAANDPHDCSKIQYVQSMEIDPGGVMWVIDVGRKYFAEFDNPAAADNTCPPKILFIDVATGTILENETYVFPTEVCPHDGCFLNDIALDLVNQVGFISDTANNASDLGGVIVYSRREKRSRRFEDPRMYAEHPPPGTTEIHGRDYSSMIGAFPTDGIGLHPSRERVFWSTLGNRQLYSLSAAELRDFSASKGDIAATIVSHGAKADGSDGMTFSDTGRLYYGGVSTDELYVYDPKADAHSAIARDPRRLRWIDTFAWSNDGWLWFTPNMLELYFWGNSSSTSLPPTLYKDRTNFRIVKVWVGENSCAQRESRTHNLLAARVDLLARRVCVCIRAAGTWRRSSTRPTKLMCSSR